MSDYKDADKALEAAIAIGQEANGIDGVVTGWTLVMSVLGTDDVVTTAHVSRASQPLHVSRGLLLNAQDIMQHNLLYEDPED